MREGWQTHPFCGSSSDRQSVGDPGHCEDCCRVGHVVAHPEFGCGDVGCDADHHQEQTLLDAAGLKDWPDPRKAQEQRLGGAVRNAWGEAVAAHRSAEVLCKLARAAGGDAMEMHGDAAVRTSCARSLWDIAVEMGEASGQWYRVVRRTQLLAEEILARPLQPGLIGAAYGQTRAIAMQAVLTRMDEILATHGYETHSTTRP
jgi:hypothetical protein